MRKLLLILLATALTGSFTSCVENQIPDEVVQIYDNQADLLAAQAALLQSQAAVNAADAIRVAAQADLLAAQAAYQLALAANQNANAARVLAEAEAAAALAAFNLQQAQDRWVIDMQTLQANLLNVKNNAITNAFNNYIGAKMTLDNWALLESTQQRAILAQMQKIQADMTSDAAALAALEGDVTVKQADLDMLNVMLADLEALKLPGSTTGDRIALKESYEATVEANTNMSHDLAIEIAQLLNAYNDAVDARVASGYDAVETDYAQLQADYTTARTDAETAMGVVAGKEAAITAEEANIANLQDIVDNYATKVSDFEAAITAAEAAEGVAEGLEDDADDALTAANTAEGNAATAEATAEALIVTENGNLAAVNAQAVAANATLDAAIAAYTAALNAVADIAPFEAAITASTNNIATAQTNYDTAKTNYDADPTGVTYDFGADMRLGNHDDADAHSFAEILTVDGAGEATFAANAYFSDAELAAAVEVETVNGWGGFVAPADIGLFFNVEADDVLLGTNAALLDAAADALDNAEAQLVVDVAARDAQLVANDTSAELAAYEAAADFYENMEAEIAAQEAVVAAAVAAEVVAEDAHDAAIAAVTAATNAQAAAQAATAAATADVAAAVADLAAFNASTEREYQVELEAAMVNLDVLNDDLATAQADYTTNNDLALSLVATIDAGPTYTADQMAASDAADAALIAHDAKEDEKTILDDQNVRLNAYIALIDLTEEANIDAEITAKETEITNAEADLQAAQDAVSNFTTSEAANQTTLNNLEDALARTQSDIANQQLRVDTLKAILDSLL